MEKNSGIKIKLKKVRVSYPNVFVPKAMEEGKEPKYSLAMLIEKTDAATIKLLRDTAAAAWKLGFPSLKMPTAFKNPMLRDGDVEKPDAEGYAGAYFVNAKSNRKPECIDQTGAPLTPDEFYPGCFAMASITVKSYDHPTGGKGVTAYLNNVMKIDEGEQLGDAGASAADDFADEIQQGGGDVLG